MTENEKIEQMNGLHSERLDLEARLQSTDYVAAKIAEGSGTVEEYSSVIAKRQGWRKRINEVDEELERLKEMEVEEEVDGE